MFQDFSRILPNLANFGGLGRNWEKIGGVTDFYKFSRILTIFNVFCGRGAGSGGWEDEGEQKGGHPLVGRSRENTGTLAGWGLLGFGWVADPGALARRRIQAACARLSYTYGVVRPGSACYHSPIAAPQQPHHSPSVAAPQPQGWKAARASPTYGVVRPGSACYHSPIAAP